MKQSRAENLEKTSGIMDIDPRRHSLEINLGHDPNLASLVCWLGCDLELTIGELFIRRVDAAAASYFL